MKEIQPSNRSVRPQWPTRFQRLDFHRVPFSISSRCKNLIRIDSVSTKVCGKPIGKVDDFLWTENKFCRLQFLILFWHRQSRYLRNELGQFSNSRETKGR